MQTLALVRTTLPLHVVVTRSCPADQCISVWILCHHGSIPHFPVTDYISDIMMVASTGDIVLQVMAGN